MKKNWLWIIICLTTLPGLAQNNESPFKDEIAAFKRMDSLQMPLPGSVLLVGSSSFRKWTDVADYFPGHYILNRGFGGSSLPDVIRYADEIIFPYNPKQIFIYCGENDIAGSDAVTADTVLHRFEHLFNMIRQKFPLVPVVFISIKPSPSRWKLEPVIRESNRLIFNYLSGKPHTRYLNIHDAMLLKDGSVRKDIFIGDDLHMNEKGYAIWQKIMLPIIM